MLRMLKGSLVEHTDARVERIMTHMDESIVRFNETINDFLELTRFSRAIGGAEAIDSSTLIQETLRFYARSLEESNTTPRVELLGGKRGKILFPKAGFSTVINNFISNAIKYRSPEEP